MPDHMERHSDRIPPAHSVLIWGDLVASALRRGELKSYPKDKYLRETLLLFHGCCPQGWKGQGQTRLQP